MFLQGIRYFPWDPLVRFSGEKLFHPFRNHANRYAAIVNDGTVEVMFEEPGKVDNNDGDPYSVSSPENVLKYLQSMAVDSNAI